MTNRPAWTLTEAVQNTTASRSTLRRYHEAGKFPDAYKDSRNQWRFPIENLLAAGIELVKSTPTEQAHPAEAEQAAPSPAPPVDATAEAELREKLHKMELALAVERQKNEGLQQLVDATKQGQSDLRRALLVLEAPKPAPAAETAPAAAPPAEGRVIALGPGSPSSARPGPSQSSRYPQARKGFFARLLGE